MDTVFFKAADRYDNPRLDTAVEQILSGCGLDEMVGPGKRVLLKVNLLMKADPEEAVTTHPAVVAAVIAALKRRGVTDILIADSPSGASSLPRLNGIYDACGMTALAEDGVSLNQDLSTVPIGRDTGMLSGIDILSVVAGADVVLNIGKLKTHAMTGLTAAVKNCFGSVIGLRKSQLHYRFADKRDFCTMLCELCQVVAPSISLMDAVVGMEGDGPSGGAPRRFGFVAGSRDPFLLDRALCAALGLAVTDARTVDASVRLGLAPADIGEVPIAGDRVFLDAPLCDLKLPASRDSRDFEEVPRGVGRLVQWFMRGAAPSPVIRKKDCIGCGRCAEICPKQIITIQNGKAVIRTASCIRCFCCHEVCPARAIDIRRVFVQRG